jgi:hypothetical protein
MRVKTTPEALEKLSNLLGEPVYDEPALAAAITRSERTIARMHSKGIGPPKLQFAGKTYYLRSSVAAWLKSQETQPVRCRRPRASRAGEA